ncbi:MAG: hypothetical protein Q8761_02870, partial [Sweet potato little leaf phytoplasma]|nr:hypothetical protein [Sweet potato little leaf phytoplasma]
FLVYQWKVYENNFFLSSYIEYYHLMNYFHTTTTPVKSKATPPKNPFAKVFKVVDFQARMEIMKKRGFLNEKRIL